ncbi:hypothetical protein Nmel_007647 [Mimus melanotis]
MIKAILIFNNHGKPRLSKFYQRYVRVGRDSAGRAEASRWMGLAAGLYARPLGPGRRGPAWAALGPGQRCGEGDGAETVYVRLRRKTVLFSLGFAF